MVDKNCISIEDLNKRLMERYKENKYIVDEEYENELYNKISLIYNFRLNNNNEEEAKIYKTNLYTKLALHILNNFMLDILQKVNEFISEKYEIDNFILSNKNDFKLYNRFIDQLENIIDTKEEDIIKWTFVSFLDEIDFMETTLFITEEDQLIRFEKISGNIKRKIEKSKNNNNNKYIILLIQYFYEYKDKLYKNKFIGKTNLLFKKYLKAISQDNDEWKISKDKKEISSFIQYEEKKYVEKSTIKCRHEDFVEGKRFKANISLDKGDSNEE